MTGGITVYLLVGVVFWHTTLHAQPVTLHVVSKSSSVLADVSTIAYSVPPLLSGEFAAHEDDVAAMMSVPAVLLNTFGVSIPFWTSCLRRNRGQRVSRDLPDGGCLIANKLLQTRICQEVNFIGFQRRKAGRQEPNLGRARDLKKSSFPTFKAQLCSFPLRSI